MAHLINQLGTLNSSRFSFESPGEGWKDHLKQQHEYELLEVEWLESKRKEVTEWAAQAPRNVEPFLKWFSDLEFTGPGQHDVLFDWLQHEATLEEMRWFLMQEVAGEAGFEDLVALSQIKLPPQPKLEMARNYWDEMGRGAEKGMHGLMLEHLDHELNLSELRKIHPAVPATLELSHLMIGLAHHRCYALHSIGALGVIELTAPERAAKVYRGLKRLGVSPKGTQYYLLHSTLDQIHSTGWNAEVLAPLVAQNPEAAVSIAEGALMRLSAGKACFDAYKDYLHLDTKPVGN